MNFVHKKDRGSSMLGMLIVILIIGVVIWFSWGGNGTETGGAKPQDTIEQATEAQINADLNTLRQALSQYRAVNGQYPPDLETLAEEGMASKQAIRSPEGELYEYDATTGTVEPTDGDSD